MDVRVPLATTVQHKELQVDWIKGHRQEREEVNAEDSPGIRYSNVTDGLAQPLFVLVCLCVCCSIFCLFTFRQFSVRFCFCVACTACQHQSGWGTRTMRHRQTYKAWQRPRGLRHRKLRD